MPYLGAYTLGQLLGGLEPLTQRHTCFLWQTREKSTTDHGATVPLLLSLWLILLIIMTFIIVDYKLLHYYYCCCCYHYYHTGNYMYTMGGLRTYVTLCNVFPSMRHRCTLQRYTTSNHIIPLLLLLIIVIIDQSCKLLSLYYYQISNT